LFTMYGGRIKFASPMYWFLGFLATFTVGGAAGVLMSVPPADFQLHNSLFLVAHFHTMIIGGVVFGYFAGLTYWFPKIFGFRLNEFLGRCAFWCWLVGFLTAFVPLYILGLMGATRRLDHYDKSMGWQGLFIVAGLGVGIIALGIFFMVLQLAYSIWKRKDTVDTTGDPWNGRTLEWSTTSPAPAYNFAIEPEVSTRDAYWEMKQSKAKKAKPHYTDILMPKNSGLAIFVSAFALVTGFAIVWHIIWLIPIGFFGAIVTLLLRLTDDHTEMTITAAEVAKIEARGRRAAA